MTATKTVVIELCKSNSIGRQFFPASVISTETVSEERTAELLNKNMENGFFYRVQSEDRTGN